MISSLSLTIFFFFALQSVNAGPDYCGGSIDNSDAADKLAAKAVPLVGNAVITNVKTGRDLFYTHDTQPNLVLSSNAVSQVLSSLSGDNTYANNVFELTDNDDDFSSTRIRNADSNKCVSSQWNFDTYCDGYAVFYDTAIGPHAIPGTLEDGKQRFMFIPLEDDEDSSSSSVHSNVAISTHDASDDDRVPACPKNRLWINTYDIYSGGYLKRHPTCKALINDSNKMIKKSKRSMLKRAGGSGKYGIALVDHAKDMSSRAVTGTAVSAFADAGAALIDYLDFTDEIQQWFVKFTDDD